MNYWTLDIPGPEYEEDEDGFYWHHRVLLKRISGPKWVALTPDQDLETVDLAELHHIVLERNADFPRAQRPYIYCFDEIPRSTLDAHKRRAGHAGRAAGIADRRRDGAVDLGRERDRQRRLRRHGGRQPPYGRRAEHQGRGPHRGRGGLHRAHRGEEQEGLDGEAQRGLSGPPSAGRPLYDKSGKRKLDLSEEVALFKESALDDFPLAGVQGFKELHDAIATAGISWTQYRSEWVTLPGVAEGSAVCHTHRVLSEV